LDKFYAMYALLEVIEPEDLREIATLILDPARYDL
jgi:hypothetical protein